MHGCTVHDVTQLIMCCTCAEQRQTGAQSNGSVMVCSQPVAALETLGRLPHIALSNICLWCRECTPFLGHVHAEVHCLTGMCASCSELSIVHFCIV